MKFSILNFSIKIKLDDGSVVRFKIEAGRVRAQKKISLFYAKPFWKFEPTAEVSLSLSLFFPNEIREINKNFFNTILSSTEKCSNFGQLKEVLEKDVAHQLQDFLEQKSEKYYSLDEIVEIFNTPTEVQEIVRSYGSVLRHKFKNKILVSSLSDLPYPQEKIESALKEALKVTKSEKRKKIILDHLFWLNFFVLDEDLPTEPHENLKSWAKMIKENQTLYQDSRDFLQRNPDFIKKFFIKRNGLRSV